MQTTNAETPDSVLLPTRDGYDRWSQIYDQEDNPLIALESVHIGSLIGDPRGRAIADIGCGTGRHSEALARAGGRVTAVDFSEGMMSCARTKAEPLGVRFLVHDLSAPEPLPLEDGAFDLVLSCLVIEHIAELDRFFRELARICHPDGSVLLSAMHPAMMLVGVSARFTDPLSGQRVYPQSHPQQISEYVMAATRAGLTFDHMSEHRVSEEISSRSPRSARYKDWPMLLLMRMRRR